MKSKKKTSKKGSKKKTSKKRKVTKAKVIKTIGILTEGPSDIQQTGPEETVMETQQSSFKVSASNFEKDQVVLDLEKHETWTEAESFTGLRNRNCAEVVKYWLNKIFGSKK